MSHLKTISSLIGDQSPIQSRYLEESLGRLSSADKHDLESLLTFYQSQGFTDSFVAESYLQVVEDILAEQIFFRKNKKYRFSSFSEVKDAVYFSDEYMTRYMIGLALTQYLWGNHKKILEFFANELPASHFGKYLEVGFGHGLYFLKSIQQKKFKSFTGLDLSPKSVELTKAMIEFHAKAEFHLECADFLTWNTSQFFDAVVLGEIIEHVEKPDEFLMKAKGMTAPMGSIFVSTCLNAPAIDHIYLFTELREVEELFMKTGLKIRKQLILPHENTSLKESQEKSLPINVGYILNHAD
ncbi:MAG: methyltransferase domain-containing protein [Bdellovibrionota bacterium]